MAREIESNYILTPEELSHNIKVYAGPGAGKTYFLVENVKNIVSTNEVITKSNSRKVLCITYTNAAVDEITKRLNKFTEYVETNTIHGFIIENIIKPFQSDLIDIMKTDFDITVNPKGLISSQTEGLGILHGIDKNEIFQFIKDSDPDKLSDASIDYSKKVMGEVEVDNVSFLESIKQGKQCNFAFKHSSKISDDHIIPLKKYIWSIVRKLTHNEILCFGYRILQKNPTALYAIRVKFPFIFVDEFQDTNPLQTLLIKLIGQRSTNICLVGDIAQSIYSFQGAKPNDFKDFTIDSERDLDFTISGNRRSTNNIVSFCDFLRQSDATVIQKSIRKYKSDNEQNFIESNKIQFLIGNSGEIANIIDRVIYDGGVVLTRSWAAAFDYIRGINDDQVKLLKTIYNSYYNTPIQLRDEIVEHNNVTWVRAFRFIFTLWESYLKGSFIDMLSAIKLYSTVSLKEISPKAIFELDLLAKKIFEEIKSDTLTCSVIQSFNDLINKDEYAKFKNLISPDTFKIAVFDDLENEKLAKAVNQLYWDTSYKLFIDVFSADSRYMTVHQAKGLEWNKVIVSVTPSKFDYIDLKKMFPMPKLNEESPQDEFVRMYYVACSRAVNELYIHIPANCSKEIIEKSIESYTQKTGICIECDYI